MPAAVPIEVSESQQRELERIVNTKTSRQREVFRARIILGLAKGLSPRDLGGAVGESFGHWTVEEALDGREAWKGSKTPREGGGKPGLSVKAVRRALSLVRTQAPHAGPWSWRKSPLKPMLSAIRNV